MAHKVICINRRCGSGGHIIGEMVAKELGIKYYDKNLLELALEYGGLDQTKAFENADEKATNSAFYRLQYNGNDKVEKGKPATETLFQLQKDLMREITSKEDCVIIGRCGDYVLDPDEVNFISVFVTAPFDDRVAHIMDNNHMNKRQAIVLTKKIDKRREDYYDFFTKRDWKDAKNYDLVLNSSALGYEKAAKLLINFYKDIM